MSGAAVGASGGGRPAAVFHYRHVGDGTRAAAMAMPGSTAETFLVHFFGTGLADDHYMVERFPTYAAARLSWPPSVIETVLAVQNDLRATHCPRCSARTGEALVNQI